MAVVFEKKEIPVTMKITESVKLLLDEICSNEDRPMSYVARELMIRGMNLYAEDQKLRGDPPKYEHLAITKDSSAQKLAPVVATISGATDPKDEVRRMINDDEIKEIQRRTRVPVLKEKAR